MPTRRDVLLYVVLASCSQAKPPADATGPRETASPEVAVRPEPAAQPAKPPPPPPTLRPRQPVRKSRVPLAEVTAAAVAIVPGEPALNLPVGAPERAAVAAACKEMCTYMECDCDVTWPHFDYLVMRLFPKGSPTGGYGWYAMKRDGDGWAMMTQTTDHPGGETSTLPHGLCSARVDHGSLPAGRGLLRVLRTDLNLDGREDLLLECLDLEGNHYLSYCLSSDFYCQEERVRLRDVQFDAVRFDADVEFRDGWFVYSIHINVTKDPHDNIRVDGVKTPDPGRPGAP